MVTKKTLPLFVFFGFSILLSGCGGERIWVSVSPQVSYLAAGQTTQFKATLTSGTGVTWSVNDVPGGDSTVGVIDAQGNYTAPSNLSGTFTIKAASQHDQTQAGTATAIVVAPGQVTTTNHPLVALYTISAPASATVLVEFGTSTSYNLTTWAQSTPADGSPMKVFVAGMHASTAYHMRAVLRFDNGVEFFDSDHVFTTGSVSNGLLLPQITVSTSSGLPPQPGIELLDFTGVQPQAVATDLTGSVIWWYAHDGTLGEFVQPIKLLPNGNFLVVISGLSNPPVPAGDLIVAREINLVGDTIREISVETLNTRLAAGGYNLVPAAFEWSLDTPGELDTTVH